MTVGPATTPAVHALTEILYHRAIEKSAKGGAGRLRQIYSLRIAAGGHVAQRASRSRCRGLMRGRVAADFAVRPGSSYPLAGRAGLSVSPHTPNRGRGS